jgi:hypothetical protein
MSLNPEYFKDILTVKTDNPYEIRAMLFKLKLGKQFNKIVDLSHKQDVVYSVLCGTTSNDEHRLNIAYAIQVEVTAGSIIKGNSIFMFPNGDEQMLFAKLFVKLMARLLYEKYATE